jgi:hypothetical protein
MTPIYGKDPYGNLSAIQALCHRCAPPLTGEPVTEAAEPSWCSRCHGGVRPGDWLVKGEDGSLVHKKCVKDHRPAVVTAIRPGQCAGCAYAIVPGEPITRAAGGYVHAECAGWRAA